MLGDSGTVSGDNGGVVREGDSATLCTRLQIVVSVSG